MTFLSSPHGKRTNNNRPKYKKDGKTPGGVVTKSGKLKAVRYSVKDNNNINEATEAIFQTCWARSAFPISASKIKKWLKRYASKTRVSAPQHHRYRVSRVNPRNINQTDLVSGDDHSLSVDTIKSEIMTPHKAHTKPMNHPIKNESQFISCFFMFLFFFAVIVEYNFLVVFTSAFASTPPKYTSYGHF